MAADGRSSHDDNHKTGSHAGDAHELSGVSDSRLLWPVGLNQLLTVGQITAGIFSGGLALMVDALHNLNDATALLIVHIARRTSRRRPTEASRSATGEPS